MFRSNARSNDAALENGSLSCYATPIPLSRPQGVANVRIHEDTRVERLTTFFPLHFGKGWVLLARSRTLYFAGKPRQGITRDVEVFLVTLHAYP